MLTFKATIRKGANSHVVTIPSDFIKHGLIVEGSDYLFEVKEAAQSE